MLSIAQLGGDSVTIGVDCLRLQININISI